MKETLFPVPPAWRIVLAFVLTPAIAALPLACIFPMYFGLPIGERIIRTASLYALIGAYPPTAVLGVPTFLFLKGRVKASAFSCGFAGAFVAVAPWFFFEPVI